MCIYFRLKSTSPVSWWSLTTVFTLFFLVSFITGCKKFVEIDFPKNESPKDVILNDSAAASSLLVSTYANFFDINFYLSTQLGLCADEFSDVSGDLTQIEFYENNIQTTNVSVYYLWSRLYQNIYVCNSLLEGISSSTLSQTQVNQIKGETQFIRSLAYFYLVNLFGDVPLVSTTDYKVNSNISRTNTTEVFDFIKSDLLAARELLSEQYPSNDKVRANKYSATALLARVCLYTKDYEGAALYSTEVINSGTYALLTNPNGIMEPNNSEAIFQIYPLYLQYGIVTYEGQTFTSPYSVILSEHVINAFDANDLRKTSWIGDYGDGRFYPFKFKVSFGFDPLEYVTVLRLAEQYLIRAEARIHQQNFIDCIDDINVVRTRAHLDELTNTLSKDELLLALEEERLRELFTEWGHRWFDLNRTNMASTVLSVRKPGWDGTDALWPIPQLERNTNRMLSQNPGYTQ